MKIIKLVISVIYLILFKLSSLLKPSGEKGLKCVVIYYHSVIDKKKFENQIKYLSNKFSFTNSKFETSNTGNKHFILLTFDDGMISVLNNALPILKEYKIPAIIFFPTGFLGKYPNWEVKKDKICSTDRIMNESELKYIFENFDIEIASHTSSHVDLQKVTEENAINELVSSKLILEKIIDKKVKYFSFPYGSFNTGLISLAFQMGYDNVFTTQPEIISLPPKNRFYGRVSVDPDISPLEFKLKVNGAYSWLPAGIMLKKKFVSFLKI